MTTNQVSKATGVSLRQLQWWDERGIVSPTIRGHRRLYEDHEIRLIRILAALRECGVPLQLARKVTDRKMVEKMPTDRTIWVVVADTTQSGWADSTGGAVELAKQFKARVAIVEIPAERSERPN